MKRGIIFLLLILTPLIAWGNDHWVNTLLIKPARMPALYANTFTSPSKMTIAYAGNTPATKQTLLLNSSPSMISYNSITGITHKKDIAKETENTIKRWKLLDRKLLCPDCEEEQE